MPFTGKKVVVTGGSGSLGRAVCSAFIRQGANVFSSYVVDRELRDLTQEMKMSEQCRLQKVELTDEDSVHTWFNLIGIPDILVNVAGGFAMGSVEDTDYDAWKHMFRVNLDTTFLTCREALRRMDPTHHGRIINVAAYVATKTLGGMAAYTTAKAGVINLTQSLAEETLSSNITVNAVLPTIMDTRANRSAMPDENHNNWVPVELAASTIMYLASEHAWHITGACVPMRGKC